MDDYLIIANWKSHGNLAAVTKWCETIKSEISPAGQREFCICPPFVLLAKFVAEMGSLLHNHSFVSLGGQNISSYGEGAYTGEINGAMLKDMGCRYVIIGHSERRAMFNEKTKDLSSKLASCLANGLIPVFCIGENKKEREADKTKSLIKKQLAPIIDVIGQNTENGCELVVAYEPVWAIGTGQAASAKVAEETHGFIKQTLDNAALNMTNNIRILYGGSVKPDNAKDFLSMPSIDGLLVGGASLDAESILKIYTA